MTEDKGKDRQTEGWTEQIEAWQERDKRVNEKVERQRLLEGVLNGFLHFKINPLLAANNNANFTMACSSTDTIVSVSI